MLSDSNSDGIPDAEDSDVDLLSNGYETEIGTDPAMLDTDCDDISDYDELNLMEPIRITGYSLRGYLTQSILVIIGDTEN